MAGLVPAIHVLRPAPGSAPNIMQSASSFS
jgi:hypothetical protein